MNARSITDLHEEIAKVLVNRLKEISTERNHDL